MPTFTTEKKYEILYRFNMLILVLLQNNLNSYRFMSVDSDTVENEQAVVTKRVIYFSRGFVVMSLRRLDFSAFRFLGISIFRHFNFSSFRRSAF